MAILFSKATLTSGDRSTTFLISGAPSSREAFAGWTAYQSFVDSLPAGAEVMAYITAYTYGGEDVVVATPEEVAYMAMRIGMRTDFLESHCQVYAEIELGFSVE